MKGKVAFFNIQKGFGKINTQETESKEVFIHFSQIHDDAKILLVGEEVEFEIESSPKGISAKNLVRLNDRIIGIIEQFDLGYGFIRTTSEEKYFVHHTDVELNLR